MTEVKATMEALVHSREIQLAIARSETDRTLNSTSWKITGPLRAVMARTHGKPKT
jgi:hypothetical protein